MRSGAAPAAAPGDGPRARLRDGVDDDCEAGGAVTWDRKADGFRFLTEAEWEYAPRAGTRDPWSGTDRAEAVCRYANVGDALGWTPFKRSTDPFCENRARGLAPVSGGDFAPNPWGLWQMSGNVWEWVWDLYGDSYAGLGTVDPTGPASHPEAWRVVRGGSLWSAPGHARSGYRSRDDPGDGRLDLGFRLALPPAGVEK